MEQILYSLSTFVALSLEVIAVLVILLGAFEATSQTLMSFVSRRATQITLRAVWRSFARWILLGLELTLAADIVRTAIAPSWNEIGQLAAIAVIRTFLNYFLERDLETSSVQADEIAINRKAA